MKTGSARRTRSYFAHLLGGIAITALIILPAGAASAADGELLWATNAGGTSEDSGRGISTLSDGSSVVTGYFSGTAVFGAGESNETTLVAAGSSDIFIARYNADGTLAWAKRAGGTGSDYGVGISSISDGSSVVTGYFSDTAVFGAGEPNETTLVSAGVDDLYIARYNADGTLAWAKRAGGTGSDYGVGISSISDGSSVVTGYFSDTAVFGAGEPNETTLVSAGVDDLYIARYNADGTLAWAKRAGGTGSDSGGGISIFSDGSSVVTGRFQDAAVFGAGEPNETTLVSGGWGATGICIARYNADGTLAWAKRAGGTGWNSGGGISSLSDGSSVVTGVFYGTAVFGAGEPRETTLVAVERDIFIARYNADGTLAWAKSAGGAGSDYGVGISSISDGSSIVTGYFTDTAVFGAGEPRETTLVSAGGDDICIARYNADGTLAWAKRAGGTGSDYGGGISIFSDGSSVVTGSFQDTAVFGAGEPNETMLVSAGWGDIFVAKYGGPPQPTPTPTPTPTETPTPTGTPIDTATPTPEPPAGAFAAVSCANAGGAQGSVWMIDLETHEVMATVAVGERPQGVCITADRAYIYAANSYDATVSVIHTGLKGIVSTIEVPAYPRGVRESLDGRSVYVTCGGEGGGGVLAVVDRASGSVARTVPVGDSPTYGIAEVPGERVLLVGNMRSNDISLIDTSLWRETGRLRGFKSPVGVLWRGGALFVANYGAGGLTPSVMRRGYASVEWVKQWIRPWQLAACGDTLYVTEYAQDCVAAMAPSTGRILAHIPVGAGPDGIAAGPGGAYLYTANYWSSEPVYGGVGTVSVVDREGGAEVGVIEVGNNPSQISVAGAEEEPWPEACPPRAAGLNLCVEDPAAAPGGVIELSYRLAPGLGLGAADALLCVVTPGGGMYAVDGATGGLAPVVPPFDVARIPPLARGVLTDHASQGVLRFAVPSNAPRGGYRFTGVLLDAATHRVAQVAESNSFEIER